MSVAKKPAFEIYRPEKRISYLKIGIYGDPGVGKTTLAATAPKPLFLNSEAGDVALRNKNVDIVRIDDFSIMPEVIDWLQANQQDPHFYQTVVIDSLTELAKQSMDHVLRLEKRDMPHQADWGRSLEYVRRVIRKMRDLDMHVVFVASAMFREDPTTGVAEHMPSLPGKLAPEIAGYFDILGFLKTVRVNPTTFERQLFVQPTPKFKAKDRTGTLGTHLPQAQLDLTKLIGHINGKEQHVTLTDPDIAVHDEK